MSSLLLSKIQACLAGVRIGDALGMPWEIKTHQEIMTETQGRGITDFCEPQVRRSDLNLPLGATTDDWALTKAIAESLIRQGAYDPVDIALSQLSKFENRNLGWGDTTRRAFRDFQAYFFSRGNTGRSPLKRVPYADGVAGAGNGVAIKIAPLALWQELKCKKQREPFFCELFLRVMQIGFSTHPHPIASLTAYALAVMIAEIISDPIRSEEQKKEKLYIMRTELARQKFQSKELDECIDFLRDRFVIVAEHLDDGDALRKKIGTGCYALESVVFAIATFLRQPRDFRGALLEAVNAGGDTDSVASMVGALVGANCGLEDEKGKPTIPAEWMAVNPEFQEAISLGERLYIAAQNS